MAVDAARVLLLVSSMLFPASLIPEGGIMIGVGQHMPFSFLPELEGGAIRLEDFFRRVVAEVSSPLDSNFSPDVVSTEFLDPLGIIFRVSIRVLPRYLSCDGIDFN